MPHLLKTISAKQDGTQIFMMVKVCDDFFMVYVFIIRVFFVIAAFLSSSLFCHPAFFVIPTQEGSHRHATKEL